MRYIILLGFLLSSGCAEVGVYDGRGCQGRYQERTTPSSYPCNCCHDNQ